MKYQLWKWTDEREEFIYEVNDDLTMERLFWSSKSTTNKMLPGYWITYNSSDKNKGKWLTKEELFIYTL